MKLRLVYEAAMSSYKYRQSSDLWYLTGFEEPDSAVILGMSDTSFFLPPEYRLTQINIQREEFII